MKTCPKCGATDVIIFDSDNDLCRSCEEWFPAVEDVREVAGWAKFPDIKPKNGQICIVAAGPGRVAQILPLRWDLSAQEFFWHEDADGFGLDPFPTEVATHWMPWPSDPQ